MRLSPHSLKKKAFADLLARDWTPEEAGRVLGLSRATAYRYQAQLLRERDDLSGCIASIEAAIRGD